MGSELASLVSTALGVDSPSNSQLKSKLGVVSSVSVPARTGTGTVEEEERGDEAQGVHLDAISPKRCCRPGAQPHLQRACNMQRACNVPACTCLCPPHTASVPQAHRRLTRRGARRTFSYTEEGAQHRGPRPIAGVVFARSLERSCLIILFVKYIKVKSDV